MPFSTPVFKKETIDHLVNKFDSSSTILDVGPGCGTYSKLLKDVFYNMDAVEIFEPYIEKYKLNELYNNVWNENILTFDFDYYNIILMGDVLEHIRSLARGNCEPSQHLHQLDRVQRSLRPAGDHENTRAGMPSAELTREQRYEQRATNRDLLLVQEIQDLVLLSMLLLYLLLLVVAVVDRDLMVVEIQLVLLVGLVVVAVVVIQHNPAHLELPAKEIKAELLQHRV